MSELVLAAIAAITFGSRALALVFLPQPGARFEAVLARMPAPIFASLATLTLITPDGALAPVPILLAAAGAVASSPRRSLPVCLVAGLAGYALGGLLV